MALGLTQPLTGMSTRNISWGKGGRCVGLMTLQPSCANFLEIWASQLHGTLRVYSGLYGCCSLFTIYTFFFIQFISFH